MATQSQTVQEGLLEEDRCGQGVRRPQVMVLHSEIITEWLLPPLAHRKTEEEIPEVSAL